MAAWDKDPVIASAAPAWANDPIVGAGDTATAAPNSGFVDGLKQGAGDILAGAVRGAGSIGSTILLPADMINQKLRGEDFWSMKDNDARRQEIDAGLQAMGADPSSTAYQGAKLGAEIAGTAGAGGVLAKGVMGAGKAIPALAPYVPKLATALETGGFRVNPASMVGPLPAATTASRAGNLALRTGAAGAVGGTAAGMIDPENAGTGAAISAAIPGGVQVAGIIGKGAKSLAGGAIQHALGLSTGAGSQAIKTAFESGKKGLTAFKDNMRGAVGMTDVLDDAKAALSQMRLNRAAEYRKGMAGVSADKTVIDFTPINNAISSLKAIGSFKGQVINKNAAGTVDDIAQTVDDWAKLNPAEYHTPEGLDALKQSIGDIRDTTQFGTAARKAADTIYNAVKKQITDQAPTYSKTMKGYSEASDLISEIQRSLVGGEKTAADTAMRKLQSLMRNNVNTNYGNRLNLARELEQQGGKEILPAVAGQALSSATPRGLQGLAATGTGLYGMANPAALAALPFQSPRLMGEAAYGAGRVSGGASGMLRDLMVNPALQGKLGLLGRPEGYMPLATVAPAVAFSR